MSHSRVLSLGWGPDGGFVVPLEVFVDRSPFMTLSIDGMAGPAAAQEIANAVGFVRRRLPAAFGRVRVALPDTVLDGPSLGLAVACATIAAVTGLEIPPHVAMTGALTTEGVVLPVGGTVHKVTAAAAAGVSCVLVPVGNLPLGPAYGVDIPVVHVADVLSAVAILADMSADVV